MKHFVLFTFMIISAFAAVSQTIVYQTTASGNYSANGTWLGGAAGKPPTTANTPACNCKIVVQPGHVLSVDQNLSLTNAVLLIKGRITPAGNGRTITLAGNSAIDIQTGGSLTRGQNNQSITLTGTQV